MFATRIRRHVDAVRTLLASADPESLSGAEAADAVSAFVDLERAGAAGKAVFTHRVECSQAFAPEGHRDAVDWLADISGASRGEALGVLRTARQVESLPSLRAAFVSGELSGPQVKEIAAVGSVAPQEVPTLMEAAGAEPLKALRERVERVRLAAMSEQDEAAREAAVHAGRFLRTTRRPDGSVRGEFSLTATDWSRCLARLSTRATAFFERARSTGAHEGRSQYLADALVDLILGARTTGTEGPRARVLVRVDASALRRGSLAPGERCEVAGVGTVSVATARELLGDALYNVVITDGSDVTAVTGTRRTIPTPLRIALLQRDPVCVVPGCDAGLGLEIDHWNSDYAKGGPTSLENLARVCKVHHDLHTYAGWQLAGGPGEWKWLKPPDHRSNETTSSIRPAASFRRTRPLPFPVGKFEAGHPARAGHGPPDRTAVGVLPQRR